VTLYASGSESWAATAPRSWCQRWPRPLRLNISDKNRRYIVDKISVRAAAKKDATAAAPQLLGIRRADMEQIRSHDVEGISHAGCLHLEVDLLIYMAMHTHITIIGCAMGPTQANTGLRPASQSCKYY
jgi:hypothetical protein